MDKQKFGYAGKICRVDLTTKQVSYEFPEDSVIRDYIGGTGLGIYYLYREVPQGIEWSDPDNRFILMTGPLTASFGPTGGYSIVTKGPMTNGAASTQAQGMFGAFLKLSGLDGLIIQGASPEPVYLHVHDEIVEIRDAGNLLGMDTWDTTESIEQELGKTERNLSVLAIGPAGENLVRFACTNSDRGHIAAHNGPGAVLGSKKLKAIAVERGKQRVPLMDKDSLRSMIRDIVENKTKKITGIPVWGTSSDFMTHDNQGSLPIKNYTESDGSPYYNISGKIYREKWDMKHLPCWGCAFKHCHRVTITEGPYKGYVGDEQEYETMAAFGPVICNTDAAAATVLGNTADKLGIDSNESGWMVGWLMECYEKGLLSANDLDGIELTWGNAEAAKKLLENICYRKGLGDKLAEGVMRAATQMGGSIQECAIYTKKGNTPRGHDHRLLFNQILDTATGTIGTDEVAAIFITPAALGLPEGTERNTAEGAAAIVAGAAKVGNKVLHDSLTICSLGLIGTGQADYVKFLSLATGWDYTTEEANRFGLRINNLFRAFAMIHGQTKEMEEPSKRYASAILKGPDKGRAMNDVWEEALDNYYRNRGWDVETGKPLPETLKEVGLDHVIENLWG